LTEKHITQFAIIYLICFLANFGWSFYNGLLFSVLQPVFFLNKLDITGNIIMLSNIQHSLLQSQVVRIIFDLVYLLLPVLLILACIQNKKSQTFIAIITSLFSIIYNYYFSIMSFVSIEVFVGWMIVPLVLTARTPLKFYYAMHSVRIIFLIFFFSAAIWKIRAGGIFNIEQMSGILVSQHASVLLNSENIFSSLINYLVQHYKIAYVLYLISFVIELSFLTGLFTKKFDKFLIVLFCLFAFLNYLLMEINYFSWLPFLGCLYFSNLKVEEVPLAKQ